MPTAIRTPESRWPRARGVARSGRVEGEDPKTKLATGLVTLIAATAGGSGPLAKAICTNNIPLSAVRPTRRRASRTAWPLAAVVEILDRQLQVDGIERVAQARGDTDQWPASHGKVCRLSWRRVTMRPTTHTVAMSTRCRCGAPLSGDASAVSRSTRPAQTASADSQSRRRRPAALARPTPVTARTAAVPPSSAGPPPPTRP